MIVSLTDNPKNDCFRHLFCLQRYKILRDFQLTFQEKISYMEATASRSRKLAELSFLPHYGQLFKEHRNNGAAVIVLPDSYHDKVLVGVDV